MSTSSFAMDLLAKLPGGGKRSKVCTHEHLRWQARSHRRQASARTDRLDLAPRADSNTMAHGREMLLELIAWRDPVPLSLLSRLKLCERALRGALSACERTGLWRGRIGGSMDGDHAACDAMRKAHGAETVAEIM